jgi:uncharacterized membrane protein YcaP (DUF421 family)
MFFDSWEDIARVLILGTFAYCAIIAILRISGKRTLAKMSAFDLVVTIALGSVLATILLSSSVALAEGVVAFVVLVTLQYAIAALSVRFKAIEKLAKSNARFLLLDGVIDDAALKKERVTREEVLCAIRSNGIGDLDDVAAVILETDGTFSVVSQSKAGARTAFPDLPH